MDLCVENLRDASYRGVPFYVESDKEAYGRRIVTHEYPMRDEPYHEDLGEKYQAFTVKGYVLSSGQKDAIVSACRQRGPASLILPACDPMSAVCMSLDVSRSKEKQGYFELSFEFRKDMGAGGGPFSIAMFESLIGGIIGDALAPLDDMLAATLQMDHVLPFVNDAAVGVVSGFAAAIHGVASTVVISSQEASSVLSGVIGLSGDATRLLERLSGGASPSELTGSVHAIFEAAYNGMAPDDAVAFFRPLAEFSIGEDSFQLPAPAGAPINVVQRAELAMLAPSEKAHVANVTALNGAFRALSLMYFGKAVSASTIETRTQAIQTRADVVELFNRQIDVTTDEAIRNHVIAARDYTVRAVTAQMATLVPVIEIEAPMSLNSLYWAYRLYKQPDRAQELYERNDVTNPSYMPIKFEALAR